MKLYVIVLIICASILSASCTKESTCTTTLKSDDANTSGFSYNAVGTAPQYAQTGSCKKNGDARTISIKYSSTIAWNIPWQTTYPTQTSNGSSIVTIPANTINYTDAGNRIFSNTDPAFLKITVDNSNHISGTITTLSMYNGSVGNVILDLSFTKLCYE
jgi:hypothetical protein